jgi:hypothetical protein
VSLVDEDFLIVWPTTVVWQEPKCWHSPAINALKQDPTSQSEETRMWHESEKIKKPATSIPGHNI